MISKPQVVVQSSGGVLSRLKPIGFDPNDGIKCLFYGASGSGKTTLWATFPGPIVVAVCSGGLQAGETRSIDTPEYREKIQSVVLQSSNELAEITQAIHRKEIPCSTLVLDHASGFSDLIIKELLGLEEIPIAKYRVAGKGESWSLVSQKQYGELAVQAKEHFRSMLNLNCNVVIIAQERVFGGKEDGLDSDVIKPVIGAALTPSLTGWLNPACDYVVQTFKRPRMVKTITAVGKKGTPNYKEIETVQRGQGVEFCARIAPHDLFMTKFRVPGGRGLPEAIVLGNSIDGPSKPTGYEQIIQLIRG